jgi:hypothetical protein
VFWQTCPSGGGSAPANTMSQGGAITMSGTFYAPCGALNLSGNLQMTAPKGGSLSVIASTIYASGSAGINAGNSSSGSGGAATILALVE